MDPKVASAAMARLDKLGVDAQAIPKRKGFVTDWRLLGPFPNARNSAFGKSLIPEDNPNLEGPVTVEGVEVSDGKLTLEFTPTRPGVNTADSLPLLCGLDVSVKPQGN